MSEFEHDAAAHRKKRRRREVAVTPVAAKLSFDDSVGVGSVVISRRLAEALELSVQDDENDNDGQKAISVAPSSSHASLHSTIWTNTYYKISEHTARHGDTSTSMHIRMHTSAAASHAFLRAFNAQDHGRHGSHLPKIFDVQVITTIPVALDTIFVTVEKGLLARVDEIQSKFGGGFQQNRNKRGSIVEQTFTSTSEGPSTAEERLTDLVRRGLASLPLVHTSDVFPLPLPPHPITHVRPAPAIVLDAEPVSQGLVTPKTKIVVVNAGASQEKALKKLAPPTAIVEESLEDTPEDDTTTDQFFSAAEDRNATTASELDASDQDESQTEASDVNESDEESDSMDDMISLSAPGLPPQQAGTLSAMTAATPKPGQYGRMTGTHTPGSVYSSFTQTTARAGSRPGKVFRTEALVQKVPTDLLHPKPATADDENSFVFIDTATLAKLGCFSGDWARIEVAKNVSTFGFGSSSLAALNGEEDSEFRVVRIFGISGLTQQRPRYVVDKSGDRRSSFSQVHGLAPSSPTIYLSPVLLANLSNAPFVKVGSMPKPPKIGHRPGQMGRTTPHRGPPMAREVSLAKILTPLTQDPANQSILISALKCHFEQSRRLIKVGDVVAVAVDEDLGKTTAQPGATDSANDDGQLLTQLNVTSASDRSRAQVAWFVVQSLDVDVPSDHSSNIADAENWGGTAILDVLQTKLGVTGSDHHQVSDSIDLWSKYWLNTRSAPVDPSTLTTPLAAVSSLPAVSKLPLEKRIADLISAATSPRAIALGLPPLVMLLHSTQRQTGKSYIATNACASVGVHAFVMSGHDLLSENASTTGGGDVKTEGLLRVRAERALSCGARHTALLLQHVDVLTADRMVPTIRDIIQSSRVIIATTSKIDDVPAGLRALFTHELEVTAPDEVARETIIRNLCASVPTPVSPSINLKNVALQTAALVAGDLVDVVHRASLARSHRLASIADDRGVLVSDLLVSGGHSVNHITQADFSTAISAARSTFSDAIGAPKIPSVTWKDVGGLASQKDAIMETISLPLTHPELFANGVRKRSGILFYGPPGTGKTLLAKAIATEFNLNFFSVKGPELLNMYIGESEANVRRVFQKARDARPCVVFFDELDSVAPKRGNQGDSGGVMDRIVSQLLAELDGMSSGGSSDGETSNAGGVFVIGATNRPDLLDPALLRPGRFDKMLYLGVADSHESQVTILEALTRKFTLAREVNLKRVAQKLPFTYTGADLYALCSDAMLKAITRKTKAVDDRVEEISRERDEPISTGWFFDHAATPEDVEVVVAEEDFDLAQNELVGSVSAKELEHFERIRRLFEDQDISAGTASAKTNGTHEEGHHIVRSDTAIRLNGTANKQPPARHKFGKGKGVARDEIEDSENDYGLPSHSRSLLNGGADLNNGVGVGKRRTSNDFHNDVGNDEELYD